MENLEKIEKTLSTAKTLRESIENYKERIKHSRCDKNGAGFNLDGRFSSCVIELSIDSWTGYCGNSGCSTAIRVQDEKIFKEHFIKELRKDFFGILERVADSIEKEASTYKEEAKKELEEQLLKVNSL